MQPLEIMNTTPVDKQAALFLSRKRHTNTVQEAVEGAVNHLMSGRLNEQLADVFTGAFGPEPEVAFTIRIRRDPAHQGKYVYKAETNVLHGIGKGVKLYGLNA